MPPPPQVAPGWQLSRFTTARCTRLGLCPLPPGARRFGVPEAHGAPNMYLEAEGSPGRVASAACVPPVPARPQDESVSPLRINRSAQVDPSSGRTYYVNSATGQSQWDAPV